MDAVWENIKIHHEFVRQSWKHDEEVVAELGEQQTRVGTVVHVVCRAVQDVADQKERALPSGHTEAKKCFALRIIDERYLAIGWGLNGLVERVKLGDISLEAGLVLQSS